METIIDMEVDGRLADYGQVLLTLNEEKIERNLSKLYPLKDFIDKEKKKSKQLVIAIACICDYIVYYEEFSDLTVQLYFMPFYTPSPVKRAILQDDSLMGQFDKLAHSIRNQSNQNYEIKFVAQNGIVFRLHKNQLN